MASHDTVLRMFSLLTANWPTYTWNEATVAVYEECLSDLPDNVLEAATLSVIGSATFFPKIGELRGAALDIVLANEGLPSVLEAWQAVKHNVTASVRHQSWPHPFVKKAIDMLGGLSEFGASEVEMEASWRKEFIRAYETLTKRQRDDAIMLPSVRAVIQQLAEARRLGDGGPLELEG